MGMNDGFFKDYGFGNYYQGTSQNTSGQTYNPTNYGGRGAFNPSDPNNLNNINPTSFRSKNPLGLMTGPLQMPPLRAQLANGNFSLGSLYDPNWGNQGITFDRNYASSVAEGADKVAPPGYYYDHGRPKPLEEPSSTVNYPFIRRLTGGPNDHLSSDWWNGLYKQLGWM